MAGAVNEQVEYQNQNKNLLELFSSPLALPESFVNRYAALLWLMNN